MVDENRFRWSWRCALAGAVFVIVVGGFSVYPYLCRRCQPVTTVFVVRHADRDGSSDNLNALGDARAQELVHVLRLANIDAIYHSDTVRTEQTATPLAEALGITPIEYPYSETTQLVSDIRSDHRGDRVLVVGHSDTVPQIVRKLGDLSMPETFLTGYDNLFVVSRYSHGLLSTVHLKYGAVTP